MPLGTIVLIVLICLLVGTAPNWQWSTSWGWGPSSVLGAVLLVVVVLSLLGRFP
jgi:hypothetical protein